MGYANGTMNTRSLLTLTLVVENWSVGVVLVFLEILGHNFTNWVSPKATRRAPFIELRAQTPAWMTHHFYSLRLPFIVRGGLRPLRKQWLPSPYLLSPTTQDIRSSVHPGMYYGYIGLCPRGR